MKHSHSLTLGDKTLLIVTNRYPHPEHDPTASIFVKQQVDILKDKFKQVVVIALVPWIPRPLAGIFGRTNPSWARTARVQDYEYDNVRVYYARAPQPPAATRLQHLSSPWYYRAAKKIIERHSIKFDLIHAHFTWPAGYVGMKLSRERGTPLVVTAHGYDAYTLPFQSRRMERIIRETLESADAIITVGKKNEKALKKIGIKKRIHIIPNGYDPELFHPIPGKQARKKLGLPQDKRIVLGVGRLVPIKGYDILLEAIQKIDDNNILFVIVGDGPERERLETLARQKNIQDRVFFAGPKPHHEIPLWMNAADLFVLPSRAESFGIVLIEALACGTPLVATKCGGPEEIVISSNYGILVEPGNPNQLATAIAEALQKKWDKKQILQHAGKHDIKNITKQIIELYTKMFWQEILSKWRVVL